MRKPKKDINPEDKLTEAANKILQKQAKKLEAAEKVAEVEKEKAARNDYHALHAIASEFLGDFIILGHTVDGQRIAIQHADSPVELDALVEFGRKVLIRLAETGSAF